MKRKLLAVGVFSAFLATGAFAQLAIGFSGSLYSDTKLSASEAASQFRNGDGVFYGPFVELGFRHLALGASGNFSLYKEDFSYLQDGSYMLEMVDYDLNLYLQGHLLRYRSVFDPFLEAGFGVMGTNFRNDSDGNNPLSITKYVDLGIGLGLNFGGLGIFVKTNWLFPGSPVQKTTDVYDAYGNYLYTTNTDQPMYDLKNYKITIGAKLIL